MAHLARVLLVIAPDAEDARHGIAARVAQHGQRGHGRRRKQIIAHRQASRFAPGTHKHVARAPRIGETRGDEQIVGQPVDISERRRPDRLARGQEHDGPLRPAAHRARLMQRAAAGEPPGSTKDLSGVSSALRSSMARSSASVCAGVMRSAPVSPVARRHAEIGAEIEQVVLRPRQRRVDAGEIGIGRALRVQPREAEHAVEFVDLAIGVDARVAFGAAARRRRGRCRRRRRCGCKSC